MLEGFELPLSVAQRLHLREAYHESICCRSDKMQASSSSQPLSWADEHPNQPEARARALGGKRRPVRRSTPDRISLTLLFSNVHNLYPSLKFHLSHLQWLRQSLALTPRAQCLLYIRAASAAFSRPGAHRGVERFDSALIFASCSSIGPFLAAPYPMCLVVLEPLL